MLLDFPELVVVGGHVGFPWLDELTTLTIKFPNFLVDTSAYTLERLPAGLRRLHEGHRLPPRHVRHQLADDRAGEVPREISTRSAFPSEGRKAFLSGNARRVFKL